MPTRKVSDVSASLLRKGFERVDTHHKVFYYVYNGVRQNVHTYISHSAKEVDGFLIGHMSNQMHLTKDQFLEFVKCTLLKEQYEEILISKGLIKNS